MPIHYAFNCVYKPIFNKTKNDIKKGYMKVLRCNVVSHRTDTRVISAKWYIRFITLQAITKCKVVLVHITAKHSAVLKPCLLLY